MNSVVAILSYGISFSFGFFLAGLVLMPHLPPYPTRPVTPFEFHYWLTNWAGVLLGALLVAADVSRLRRKRQRHASENPR